MGIEPTSEAWENHCVKFQIESAINLERERPTRDEPACFFFGVPLGSRTTTFVVQNHRHGTIRATESTRLWRKRVGVEPTTRLAESRIAGFEGREDHRIPFASAVCKSMITNNFN